MSPLQLQALGLTVLLEAGGMGLLLFLLRKSSGSPWRPLLTAVVVNLITHTIFWNLFPLTPGAFLLKLWAWEGGITLVEALAYRAVGGLDLKAALGAGVALNLFSMYGGAWLLY